VVSGVLFPCRVAAVLAAKVAQEAPVEPKLPLDRSRSITTTLRSRIGRRGVTLLELILALSLSVLLLMAINMAITLHFKMLDVRRTNIEEIQVARVTLKLMADDLRGVLLYTAPDLSGLQAVTGNAVQAATSMAGGAGGQPSGSGDGGGGGGGGASST